MNIIYKLVNRQKEQRNEYPCYYIGSKANYVPGTYWGSARHPLLLLELKTTLEDFELIIIEYVDSLSNLIEREHFWQKKYNVVQNEKYYNLSYANKKFSSIGFKWAHDPVTLTKGYFPNNKIPVGWNLGKTPESKVKKSILKTGYKKGSIELNQEISKRTKVAACRGKNHKDCKIWILQDPNGTIHTVIGLHEFCRKFNLSVTSLQFSEKSKKQLPINKGKSKGWRVLDKKLANCLDNKEQLANPQFM